MFRYIRDKGALFMVQNWVLTSNFRLHNFFYKLYIITCQNYKFPTFYHNFPKFYFTFPNYKFNCQCQNTTSMKRTFVSNQLALLLLCLNQHMRNRRNSFFSVKQNCSNSCRVPLIPIETTILSNDFYISTSNLFYFLDIYSTFWQNSNRKGT